MFRRLDVPAEINRSNPSGFRRTPGRWIFLIFTVGIASGEVSCHRRAPTPEDPVAKKAALSATPVPVPPISTDDSPKKRGVPNSTVSLRDRYADLAKRDLKMALREALAATSSEARKQALFAIAWAMFKENLDAVPEILATATDAEEREGILYQAEISWGRRDYKYLYDVARNQLDGSNRDSLEEKAFGCAMREKDFSEGRRMLDQMSFSSTRSACLRGFAMAYVRNAPGEAMAWASSLPLAEDQAEAYSSMAHPAAVAGDIDTLNAILQVTTDKRLISSIVADETRIMFYQQGADATLSWIDGLPTHARDAAIGTYVRSAEIGDAQRLLSQIQQIQSPNVQTTALYAVFGRMANADPKGAMDQAMALTDSFRRAAVHGVISSWYRSDSDGVSTWANTLPQGPDRDAVLAQLADLIKPSDPNAAAQTAMGIQDQKLRESTLKKPARKVFSY